MVSLFHLFEFSYPDGMLFFDRSGLIGQRLQAAFPGLLVKSTATDQRDFVLHEKSLDLYYGFSTAHIQSLAPNCSDFPEIAQKFFQIVVSTLEISVIKEFRFRYVVGRPCDSPEQAQQLLLPHIPQETQTQLGKIDFKIQKVLWHASQAEFSIDNVTIHARTAIVDLPGISSRPTPHLTFHIDCRAQTPMALVQFDPLAFMNNVRDTHLANIRFRVPNDFS